MADVLVGLDVEHDLGREQGPCFDGPKDEAIWALYLVHPGDWERDRLGELVGDGLTYAQALELAVARGYTSIPIRFS